MPNPTKISVSMTDREKAAFEEFAEGFGNSGSWFFRMAGKFAMAHRRQFALWLAGEPLRQRGKATGNE